MFAALSVFQYCYNSSPKKNKNIMASFSYGRFAVFVVPGGHAQQLVSGPGLLCERKHLLAFQEQTNKLQRQLAL